MVTQELLDYIKQQIQLGTDRGQIKATLTANSWVAEDVEEAFSRLTPNVPKP